jgi:hypothetical protein
VTDTRTTERPASIESQSVEDDRPDPRHWKALVLLCVATFMIILEARIVILAPPSIEKHLGMPSEMSSSH